MELQKYLSLIWKWLWLIGLSVILAGASTYMASRRQTPIYSTKTTLMVGRVIQSSDPNNADLYTGSQLAYIYAQLVRREPVLKGAIDSLGLNMNWRSLASRVSANTVFQTQLLEIYVNDSNPYRAKVLADAISQQLILQSPAGSTSTTQENLAFIKEQLSDLEVKIKDGREELTRLKQELDLANSALQIQNLNGQVNLLETKISNWQGTYSQLLLSTQGGGVNTLSIVEEATIPTYPIGPNVMSNVMIASAIGLVLAAGGAILIEYLDDTVKSEEDIEKATKMPTLGHIAKIRGDRYASKLVALLKPLSPVSESFRVLQTNIQYSSVDRSIRTLLITSSGPGVGKSICAANLAVVMAQSGKKVILVDSDLRHRVLHEFFTLTNIYGLSDVLLDPEHHIDQYLQETEVNDLKILTSGVNAPNPAGLLGSQRMNELIEELKRRADIVIFDCPPLLVAADALVLSMNMDGVIMVADQGRTRTNELRLATTELQRARANLLGVVLNQRTIRKAGYGYYYYQDDHQVKIWKPRFAGTFLKTPWLPKLTSGVPRLFGNLRSNPKLNGKSQQAPTQAPEYLDPAPTDPELIAPLPAAEGPEIEQPVQVATQSESSPIQEQGLSVPTPVEPELEAPTPAPISTEIEQPVHVGADAPFSPIQEPEMRVPTPAEPEMGAPTPAPLETKVKKPPRRKSKRTKPIPVNAPIENEGRSL